MNSKKIIRIGILVVLAIPAVMWLYGVIGMAMGAFKPIEVATMNAISKSGAKLVLDDSGRQQVEFCERFTR